jgi:TonB family protein
LYSQAHALDPSDNSSVEGEARIYMGVFVPSDHSHPNAPNRYATLSATLRVSLENSKDPSLLKAVGEMLVRQNRPGLPEVNCAEPCHGPDASLENFALLLLQRAVDLQPDNPRFQQALADGKRIANGESPSNLDAPPSAVRIGAKVAEANLLTKVDPIYPPLAEAARVQGTVEFTATIGETGKVINLQLVRGHPLLVNAAKEAVLQWKYRPTLLNGQPVTIVTSVIVDFTLTPSPGEPAQTSQPPKL